jgi:hypothetical protein
MLEDGFSFTISPKFVFNILGIPFGGNTVELKSGKEFIDHINQIVGTNNPTVEFLCALLKNDLDEKHFLVLS